MARKGLSLTVLALAWLSLLAPACRPRSQEAERPSAAPAPVPAAAPAPPATPSVLGRAELLQAVEDAAAAYAANTGEAQSAKALAGRRFAVRIPFGCAGPGPDEAAVGYVYDDKSQTLRLRARPQAWAAEAWVRSLVGSDDAEAVEGFWIPRPWLRQEACPAWSALSGEAPALGPADQTVGLVQVFREDSSRLGRVGARGYQATVKAAPEAARPIQGFRLALEGRIWSGEGRGPVRCRSSSPDRRPVCLVMVEFDRVAFEDAEGAVLSEWRS